LSQSTSAISTSNVPTDIGGRVSTQREQQLPLNIGARVENLLGILAADEEHTRLVRLTASFHIGKWILRKSRRVCGNLATNTQGSARYIVDAAFVPQRI
jgi:hypothetical protein